MPRGLKDQVNDFAPWLLAGCDVHKVTEVTHRICTTDDFFFPLLLYFDFKKTGAKTGFQAKGNKKGCNNFQHLN